MLAKNEVLQGRYKIIRQLGHGGMGAVYEAQDERLGSMVALKEIIIEIDKIPTQKQRELFRRAFEREARLLAGLHHEVFPRVMDYFSEEKRQFLIMELVYGDDLGELLQKNETPFALDAALLWADHLLDALDYLHTQTPPIFHRDIKPQNLKATFRGKIKLLDFGIARSVDQTASTATDHTFVGATADYAPIEQILPAIKPTFREFIVLKHPEKANAVLSQKTDSRCDLYAVGSTFYHLLTNRVPTDSAERSLKVWEGNADPLPNPSEINAEIPPPISAWLLKALEIERENRFASALEMQKALQTAIKEAKAENKTSEKTLVLPVKPISSKVDKEQRLDEHSLTEAKTKNLLGSDNWQNSAENSEQSQIKTEERIISHTQASPTQSAYIEPPETKSEISEPSITESLQFDIAETQPSGSVSKPELTDTPYFDEKLVKQAKSEEKRPVPIPFVETKPESKSGFNLVWLLPIFALGLLTVGGIGGGIVWLNSSNSEERKESNSNISTATPTVSPTLKPTISPTPAPTVSNPVVSDEKPTPTPAPTVQKTPIQQTPVKTPVVRTTPKPKPTKDSDCIFTGDC